MTAQHRAQSTWRNPAIWILVALLLVALGAVGRVIFYHGKPAGPPRVVTKTVTKVVTRQVYCLTQEQGAPLREVYDSLRHDFGAITELDQLRQFAYAVTCK